MAAQPLRRTPAERVANRKPDVLDRARAQRARRETRVASIWDLTPAQRRSAFYAGDLTFGQCLEWARRAQHEVPKAADGEFLFIACRTPEWLGD